MNDILIGAILGLVPGLVILYEMALASVQQGNEMFATAENHLEPIGIGIPRYAEQAVQSISWLLLVITIIIATALYFGRKSSKDRSWVNGLVSYWSMHWTSFVLTILGGALGATGPGPAALQASVGIIVALLIQALGMVIAIKSGLVK